VRPVELGISERTHYRDIAALTAKGAPIYGVDIDVLQFVERRVKLDASSGHRLTQLVDQDYRRVARRQDVGGQNLDLWGMPADVLEILPGYGMPFCPTFLGFRDQRAALSMATSPPGDGCRRQPKR